MKHLVLGYPLLFAISPVMNMASSNSNEVTSGQLLSTILVVCIITLVLSALVRLTIRDSIKTAAVVSVILLAFFSYARIYAIRDSSTLGLDDVLIRHRYLLPLYVLGIGVGLWMIIRRSGPWLSVMHFAAVVASLLIMFNVVTFAAGQAGLRIVPNLTNDVEVIANKGMNLPDIYFMLYDTYPRKDVLAKYWGHDNTEFEQMLIAKGFYIVEKSRSNYWRTAQSLSSSMNMTYLQDDSNWAALLRNSKVLSVAHELGYRVIVIDADKPITTHLAENSDFYLRIKNNLLISNFTAALLDSTPLRWLFPRFKFVKLIDLKGNFVMQAVEAFDFGTSQVTRIAGMPEPTFTVLYRFPPHPPYIFEKDGEIRTPSNALVIEGEGFASTVATGEFVNQLIYVNTVIRQTVEEILRKSDQEPIIIIQGDHGTNTQCPCRPDNLTPEMVLETTGIFNAILLPQQCGSLLYPEMSSVNTFRVIFDACLMQEFGLLPDVSYYHDRKQPPWDFLQVYP